MNVEGSNVKVVQLNAIKNDILLLARFVTPCLHTMNMLANMFIV
eukprot:COSAG06_NODE_3106_length_5852_cov_6.243177_1_plen_44_part_00